MRVRFPSLLVPRRRRLAAEPRENIGGWREVAPLTVTVNLRPITTVRPAVGGTIRPLVTRGLAVPARLTMAIGRPVDVRPAVDRPRRPVPTISRMERAPLPSVVTEEPEPAESWTDDDSIAELRAILNAARRQAAETDAPEADEPWQAPEPVDDDAVVVRSWPEPGAPPVRLPWEQDEPPAVAGIQEPPSRNRLAEPAPGRPRRLSLAESRRRGITVRPRHAEEPTVERRPVRVSPTPAAARPEKPGVPAEPEFVLPADEPAEAPADRQPEPEPAAPMRPPDEPADHGPELDWAGSVDVPVEPADRDPELDWAGSVDVPVEPVDRDPELDWAGSATLPVEPADRDSEPELATSADLPADEPAVRELDPELVALADFSAAVSAGRKPEPADVRELEPEPAAPANLLADVLVGREPDPKPVALPSLPANEAVARADFPADVPEPASEPAHRRPDPESATPAHLPTEPTSPAGARSGPGPQEPREKPPPVSPTTRQVVVVHGPVVGRLPDVELGPPLATPVGPSEPAEPTAHVRQVPDEPQPPRLGLGAPLHHPPDRRAEPEVLHPVDAGEPAPAVRRPGLGAPVTVHRGPAVNEQARAWRARAFTRDGEIYLPDTHDHRAEQATLAHELVHVVQQRTHGDELPPEWTPAGRALEHEAVAATPYPAPPPVYDEPFGVPAGVQRQPDDVMTMTFPPQHQDVEPPEETEPQVDALAEYRDQLIAMCGKRTVDMNDSRSVNELAARLYQPLRGLLRGELIVDRERAGLLTDFR